MSVEIAWKQNILVTDFQLLKSLLVVLGFGLQAFVCGFSRQNICSVPRLVNAVKERPVAGRRAALPRARTRRKSHRQGLVINATFVLHVIDNKIWIAQTMQTIYAGNGAHWLTNNHYTSKKIQFKTHFIASMYSFIKYLMFPFSFSGKTNWL